MKIARLLCASVALVLCVQCGDDSSDNDTGSGDSSIGGDSDIDTGTGKDLVAEADLIWVFIPGGSFEMGSTKGDSSITQPVHTVTVPDFEMLKTEVTAMQYQICIDAHRLAQSRCTTPDCIGGDCNWNASGYENHPVNYVGWSSAVDFCTWVGGRLPSEAEWEYAARSGGQDIAYPWGDETATCDYAVMRFGRGNGAGCGTGRTMEVCSKTDGNTDQGLCDMAGNVSEWVQDCYHKDYTDAPADGSEWNDDYSCSVNIVRGGAYSFDADMLRAACRGRRGRSGTYFVGFRCAR